MTVTGGILCLAMQSIAIHAEQVRMYDTPPSAEEMGRLLFGGQTSDAPGAMKMRSINFKPKTNERADDMAIAQRIESERTSVGLPIKFAYNSAEILPESMPFLEEVGKMMTMSDFADRQLIIEGHTDAVGSASYNLELSRRRAQAVRNYLATNFGVSTNRLTTKGLGKSKPLPGRDPFDAVNRRVQFYSAN
jgi:outer membrane protein OmpA-like peptidoglycan-associated protein